MTGLSARESRYPAFHVRFRGFDRQEVVAALAKLASENREARHELNRVGGEIERLQASVAELHDGERQSQRALTSAYKLADDIRERAEEEARQIVRDAEQRGEALLQQARERLREIEGQIDELAARRRDVELAAESLVRLVNESRERDRPHQREVGESGEGSFGDALAPTG